MANEATVASGLRTRVLLAIAVVATLIAFAAMFLYDEGKIVECTTSVLDPRTGEVVDARPSLASADPGQRPAGNGLSVTDCRD